MVRHVAWRTGTVFLLALASMVLLGCNIEKYGQKADNLLDDINDPSPRASSPTRARPSAPTLDVDRSLRTDVHMVTDVNGDTVEVFGQSSSSSTTPGHDNTIAGRAWNMARSGRYRYITMQRSWIVATGLKGVSPRVPDLIGVRRDDRVDAYEIQSQSDRTNTLIERLKQAMETLPAEHRGEFDVFPADPEARGDWFDR